MALFPPAEINANILSFFLKKIIPSVPVFQRDHLQAAGHLCILKDTSDYESPLAISTLISSEKLEAALGIHLFKAGKLLQGKIRSFGYKRNGKQCCCFLTKVQVAFLKRVI